MNKRIYKILLLLILVCLTGCGRTVTDKADAGAEIQFDITFGSTFAPDENRMYYVFFPKISNPSDINKLIPSDGQLITTDNTYTNKYFFDMPEDVTFVGFDNVIFRDSVLNSDTELNSLAGITTNVLGEDPVSFYYEKFHSNSYSYLRLEPDNIRWINGPFSTTADSTVDFYPDDYSKLYTLKSAEHIQFSWPLSKLGYAVAKDVFVPYFIVSVVVTQNIPYIYDWISSIEGIENSSGRLSDLYYDGSFSNHPTINNIEQLDILTWQVAIQ